MVDLISRGRVSYVVGIGYRDEEFEMFDVERRGRGHLVEERIGLLQRLWTGDPVDVGGRSVRVTPLPLRPVARCSPTAGAPRSPPGEQDASA